MNLCKYKNIFGIPGQGIHSYRFLNIAIMDLLMTLIFSFIIAYIFKINFYYVSLFTLILGIILHKLFCVRTTIDKLLFG